jgi:SOS-response transcriptional repressor LexA
MAHITHHVEIFVNGAYNNILFTATKMVCMNEQMTRLYAAARESSGIRGQSDLARALNTSPQTVNNWENRGVSKQGLLHIQSTLGISASWIETGQGKKFVQDKSNVSASQIGHKQIPLISYVHAGHWAGAVDAFQPNDAHDWLVTDLDLSEGAFALEIKGDSMLPDFSPGDRVIIDPDIQPQPGDYVVAKNGEDEATFKKYRLRSINDQGEPVFELVPLNPDYPSIRSDQVPIHIVGTMVEVRKYRRK